MATNPFAQFDTGTSPPSGADTSQPSQDGQGGPDMVNPFAQYDTEAHDSVGNTLGQFASGAAEGIAALPGLPADLMTGVYNGLEYADSHLSGRKANYKEGKDLPWAPWTGNTFRTMAERNLPLADAPNTTTGRFARSIGEFAGPTLVSGAGLFGLASKASEAGTAGRMLTTIANNPGRFALAEAGSAVGGGAGAEGAHEAFPDSSIAPVIGGLVGGFSPNILTGVSNATRSGLVGITQAGRQAALDAGDSFGATGITPTMAQIAPRTGLGRMVERTVSLLPGGSYAIADRLVKQAERAEEFVRQTVQDVVGQAPSEASAGRAISEGIDAKIADFKTQSGQLYDRVDALIPPQLSVSALSTQRMLAQIVDRGAASPELQAVIRSPLVERLNKGFQASADQNTNMLTASTGVGPQLPYQTLKDLRTFIGSKLDNAPALGDASTGEMKQLYGALTQDLGAAAKQAGPQAEGAFARANRYYQLGRERIDKTLSPIVNGRLDAEVYDAMMRKDAGRVHKVMASLNPEQRDIVAAQVFQGMGRARPGAQNATGNAFSFETFLTNYINLRSDRLRGALFGSSPQLRVAMDNLAAVSERVRQAEKYLPNPSGTARGFAQIASAGGIGSALFTGNLPLAAQIGMLAYVAPYVTARMLTSPRLVGWLTHAAEVPVNQWPGHFARLAAIVRQSPHLALDVANMMAGINNSFDMSARADEIKNAPAPSGPPMPRHKPGDGFDNGHAAADPAEATTIDNRQGLQRNDPQHRGWQDWKLSTGFGNNPDGTHYNIPSFQNGAEAIATVDSPRMRGIIRTKEADESKALASLQADANRTGQTIAGTSLSPSGTIAPQNGAQPQTMPSDNEFTDYKPGEIAAFAQSLQSNAQPSGVPVLSAKPGDQSLTGTAMAPDVSGDVRRDVANGRGTFGTPTHTASSDQQRAAAAFNRISDAELRDKLAGIEQGRRNDNEDERQRLVKERLQTILMEAALKNGARDAAHFVLSQLQELGATINQATEHSMSGARTSQNRNAR